MGHPATKAVPLSAIEETWSAKVKERIVFVM
jgi:hypothetical protein